MRGDAIHIEERSQKTLANRECEVGSPCRKIGRISACRSGTSNEEMNDAQAQLRHVNGVSLASKFVKIRNNCRFQKGVRVGNK
jgi:hypothetical protein